jgi:cytochrome c-type biogenesis protein CcmF
MGFFEQRFGAHGFLGEHLWLGHLGFFFLVLSFSASILAFVSYCFAEFKKVDTEKKSWQNMGRVAFSVHGVAVLGIFVLLFIMILNHWFEYHYAWHHSSKQLPMKYIISSFWEGQEGSFLLWQFWLVILGWVGIRTLKEWESPVIGMTALTQVFLGSMVIGINILGHHIGSNPFVLLRNELTQAPIFQRPEYLGMIADGNGLNPLLQNYWMTIHPPVLFCGFASALFPFAFVIAALIRNDYTGWVKPALPWALFNIAVLGTGILMGGAWAYESLSFGGFWAWDPVENMSLVPWLFIVAGLHLHLVYKYTKHGIFSTFLFYILGFVMVLYSTFLTRSGILGDTSVHAFTDLGMTGQLVIYLFAFLIPSLFLLFFRYRSLPSPAKEEEILSREFWMFIGALVLLFSAVQQIFTTSIPVWNILGHDWLHVMSDKNKIAPPADVIGHYNSIQVWLAVLAGFGTALIQYFSYISGKLPSTARWAWYSLAIAIVLSIGIGYGMDIDFLINTTVKDYHFKFISPYYLMLIASVYSIVANSAYLATVLKGNFKLSGGAIAHLGFGVFLLGVLLSQYKKETISLNTAGVNFGKDFSSKDLAENILLVRDSVYKMGDYEVSYRGLKPAKPNNLYEVHYVKRDKDGTISEEFSLFPNAQINPKMGMLANPDTKHYLTKDVFTHVTSVPDNSKVKDKTTTYEAGVGDTFFTKKNFIVFKAMNPKPTIPEGYDMKGKVAVGAVLDIKSLDGTVATAEPIYVINMGDNSVSTAAYENADLQITINIAKINPETKKFSFQVTEKELASDFVIMKAILFPYIKLVWLGGIITFFGVFLSMYRRFKENKQTA